MLRVLFLGYDECPLLDFLSKDADVTQTMDKMSLLEIKNLSPDLIISYGYKHIIKKDVIDAYDGKIINLHISYLPWNKGMYPNMWSIIDDTPKGVTIHLIDEGIDTGDILFQCEVKIEDEDTLSSSYWRLREEIEDLFMKKWNIIKTLKFIRTKQVPDGTFHLKKLAKNILTLWEF